MLHIMRGDEIGQMAFRFLRDDTNAGGGLRHEARLVQGFLAAANDDNHLVRNPEEGGKISQQTLLRKDMSTIL